MVGPMARPGARGLVPGLGLKYEIVLRAGPGYNCCGPGPHNSICGLGPGLHNCRGPGPGLGLKSYLRVGPGPRFQARTGP